MATQHLTLTVALELARWVHVTNPLRTRFANSQAPQGQKSTSEEARYGDTAVLTIAAGRLDVPTITVQTSDRPDIPLSAVI